MLKNKKPLLDWKKKAENYYTLTCPPFLLCVDKQNKEWIWGVANSSETMINSLFKSGVKTASLLAGQNAAEKWLENEVNEIKERFEATKKLFICENCGKAKPIEERNFDEEFDPYNQDNQPVFCDRCWETGLEPDDEEEKQNDEAN